MTSLSLETIVKAIIVLVVLGVIIGIFYYGLFPNATREFFSKVNILGLNLGKNVHYTPAEMNANLKVNADYIAQSIQKMNSEQPNSLLPFSLKEDINLENKLTITSIEENGKGYLRIIIDQDSYLTYLDYTPSKKNDDAVLYEPCVADYYTALMTDSLITYHPVSRIAITTRSFTVWESLTSTGEEIKESGERWDLLMIEGDIKDPLINYKDSNEDSDFKNTKLYPYYHLIGLVKVADKDGNTFVCFARRISTDEYKFESEDPSRRIPESKPADNTKVPSGEITQPIEPQQQEEVTEEDIQRAMDSIGGP